MQHACCYGAFLNRLGRNDEFERPVGIAVDDQRERVYVSDVLKHHIVVFDFAGQRISTMGNVYVSDAAFNNVQMFSRD